MSHSYRPIDLARAASVSVQTVRVYERLGFLPPAQRSETGYRQYTAKHRQALLTARTIIDGYGWRPALRVMRQVHAGRLEEAVKLVNGRHAALHREGLEAEEHLAALRKLSQGEGGATGALKRRRRIGEAAELVGVQVSALRFWEQKGLLRPDRDPESGYRLYDGEQIRRLRVVVLLRQAGYGIERIHEVVDELAKGDPEQAVVIAEQRLRDLAQANLNCVAATATVWEYVREYLSSQNSVD